MPFIFRKRFNILPFLRLNLSNTGWSWTWHAGPFSKNSRTGQSSVDLPGPINYRTRARRRRRDT